MELSTSAQKGLDKFMKKWDKKFGEGSLYTGHKIEKPEAISSGSIALDYATGIGGWPEGRITEFYGEPDLGKTTIALIAVAEAQTKYPDRMALYIDVENKLDREWAQDHGVDLDRLLVYVPTTAEETADSIAEYLNEELFCIVVLDSIGAMISRVEMEKQADEATVATVAKIVTRMVRAANSQAKVGKPVIIFINQMRSSISKYGSPIERPGGWALKFQSTMLVNLKKGPQPVYKAKVGASEIPVARLLAITIERNKCAPAGRTSEVMLVSVPTAKYGPIGVDKVDEAVTVGIDTGVIKRGGAWYTLPNEERVMGRDSVLDYVRNNPELIPEIRDRIIALRAEEITDDLGEVDTVEVVNE